jgi:hypothetical protein
MGSANEADGKNSLLGEFLLALARAPEPVQEAILLYGLKQMTPYATSLISPYPMLSHMMSILRRQQGGVGTGGSDDAA